MNPLLFCDGIDSFFHVMVLVIICVSVRLHAPTLFFPINFLVNSQKHLLTNETYHTTGYDGPYIGAGEKKNDMVLPLQPVNTHLGFALT